MGQVYSKYRKNRRAEPRNDETTPPPLRDKSGSPPRDESSELVSDNSRVLDGRIFKLTGNPSYFLPNDKVEYNRLHTQHIIFRYIFQSNYQAPITKGLKRGIKVIDVGCGSGAWSVDLANSFPNSTFIGTDIINAFAEAQATAPSNCTFLEADTLEGLPFDDDTFDFVFQRAHSSCFAEDVWPNAIKELVRVAKPGGYIELLDAKFPSDCGPALTKHTEWLYTVMELRGINISALATPKLLIEAGITDVKSLTVPWHLGWGPDKRLGEMSAQNYVTVLKSSKPSVCAALGIEDEEFNQIYEEAEKELTTDGAYKATALLFSHYGRKPSAILSEE